MDKFTNSKTPSTGTEDFALLLNGIQKEGGPAVVRQNVSELHCSEADPDKIAAMFAHGDVVGGAMTLCATILEGLTDEQVTSATALRDVFVVSGSMIQAKALGMSKAKSVFKWDQLMDAILEGGSMAKMAGIITGIAVNRKSINADTPFGRPMDVFDMSDEDVTKALPTAIRTIYCDSTGISEVYKMNAISLAQTLVTTGLMGILSDVKLDMMRIFMDPNIISVASLEDDLDEIRQHLEEAPAPVLLVMLLDFLNRGRVAYSDIKDVLEAADATLMANVPSSYNKE